MSKKTYISSSSAGVLVRRPTGPVAGIRPGDAGDDTTGFDVLAEQDVQRPRAGRSAGPEAEAGVRLHVGVAHVLDRVVAVDRRADLGDVHLGVGLDPDRRIARNVEGVETAQSGTGSTPTSPWPHRRGR